MWQQGTLSYHNDVRRWLLPDGRSAKVRDAPLGIDPHNGIPHVATRPRGSLYWPGSRWSIAMLALDGLLGALATAYLFVGAILLLRDDFMVGAAPTRAFRRRQASPADSRRRRVSAWAAGLELRGEQFLVPLVVGAVCVLAYPVAIVFVMRSQTLRAASPLMARIHFPTSAARYGWCATAPEPREALDPFARRER